MVRWVDRYLLYLAGWLVARLFVYLLVVYCSFFVPSILLYSLLSERGGEEDLAHSTRRGIKKGARKKEGIRRETNKGEAHSTSTRRDTYLHLPPSRPTHQPTMSPPPNPSPHGTLAVILFTIGSILFVCALIFGLLYLQKRRRAARSREATMLAGDEFMPGHGPRHGEAGIGGGGGGGSGLRGGITGRGGKGAYAQLEDEWSADMEDGRGGGVGGERGGEGGERGVGIYEQVSSAFFCGSWRREGREIENGRVLTACSLGRGRPRRGIGDGGSCSEG